MLNLKNSKIVYKVKNMKLFLFILLVINSLYGDINNQYFNTQDVTLKVIYVNTNDTLNLRELPSSKSKIVYKIPYNSTTLTTNGRTNKRYLLTKHAFILWTTN